MIVHDRTCEAAAQAARARRYTAGALWLTGAWCVVCTLALGALVAAGFAQAGYLVWQKPYTEIQGYYVPLPGTVNPPPGVVLRRPLPPPDAEPDSLVGDEGGAPAL